MRKSLKRLIVAALIFLVLYPVFLICAALLRNASTEWHPASQPGTVWQSTDKRMTFMSNSNGNVMLTAETENGTVEIEMYIRQIPTNVSFCEISDENSDEMEDQCVAWGSGSPRGKNRYVVGISYVSPNAPILSTLFEPGDVIVFRKIDTIANIKPDSGEADSPHTN